MTQISKPIRALRAHSLLQLLGGLCLAGIVLFSLAIIYHSPDSTATWMASYLLPAWLTLFIAGRGLRATFSQLSQNLRRPRDMASEHNQRLMQKILDTTPSYLSLWDMTNNRFLYANANMAAFFESTPETFQKIDPQVIFLAIHPDDQPIHGQFLASLAAGRVNQTCTAEFRTRNARGEWRWMSCRGLVFQTEACDQTRQVLFSAEDVTENRRTRERLHYLSTHDALTGLYNRAYFQEALGHVREAAEFPAAIIMMDVDNLKQVNDTFGHEAGDMLLREIAELLADGFRAGDVVARVGGDEFIALLPGVNQADAREIVQRVQARFRAAASPNQRSLDVLSIGLCVARDANELDEATRLADLRMYLAKQQRKMVVVSLPFSG